MHRRSRGDVFFCSTVAITSIATEEISTVATEEISYVASDEIPCVKTEVSATEE